MFHVMRNPICVSFDLCRDITLDSILETVHGRHVAGNWTELRTPLTIGSPKTKYKFIKNSIKS